MAETPEKKVPTRPRDAPGETTVKVLVTFRHLFGTEQSTDYLVDYFAAAIGRDNGARDNALRLKFDNPETEQTESIYEVKLVDD
jgi:hypothetical protein